MALSIHDIDEKMSELIDNETGELLNIEAFEALQMERDKKIENMALWVKNLRAEATAIEAEIAALTARSKAAKKKADKLQEYLSFILQGEKFTTSKVAISFKSSPFVEVDEDFLQWAMEHDDSYLKFKEPEVSRSAIRAAIKEGKTFEHARIAVSTSMQIK